MSDSDSCETGEYLLLFVRRSKKRTVDIYRHIIKEVTMYTQVGVINLLVYMKSYYNLICICGGVSTRNGKFTLLSKPESPVVIFYTGLSYQASKLGHFLMARPGPDRAFS